MGSRVAEKRERRAERERREVETERARQRRRRLGLLAAVALAAVAIVVALAVASGGGGEGSGGLGEGEGLRGAAEVNGLFEGIPQDGIALGDADAPVTLVEFVDLQCPFCGQFARDAMPELVRDYVETGDVRIELRTLRFLGPDSDVAARTAAAAALQDRMWQFTELFFRNQGAEGSGYVTDDFLRGIAGAVDGLDAERALDAADSAEAESLVARDEAAAGTLGVQSTPSFFAGPTDGRLRQLRITELSAGAVGAQLDDLLARAR